MTFTLVFTDPASRRVIREDILADDPFEAAQILRRRHKLQPHHILSNEPAFKRAANAAGLHAKNKLYGVKRVAKCDMQGR